MQIMTYDQMLREKNDTLFEIAESIKKGKHKRVVGQALHAAELEIRLARAKTNGDENQAPNIISAITVLVDACMALEKMQKVKINGTFPDIVRHTAALNDFCRTVEATGGVVEVDTGFEPVADREWYDLADSYIKACDALGRKPKVENKDGDEKSDEEGTGEEGGKNWVDGIGDTSPDDR
jgi:hypothetical protein